jgi:tetratricopeptide (TPR) repeat protein
LPALFGALAAGRPVDAAVAEARKAIYAVSPLEWATPVLHLRADNARLFDISRLSSMRVHVPSSSEQGDIPTQQLPVTEAPTPPDESLGSTLLPAYRLAQESEAGTTERRADVLTKRGRLHVDQGRFREAETTLREAIRFDPNNIWAHVNLGRALEEMSRYAEAEAEYQNALRLDPEHELAKKNITRLRRKRKKLATVRGETENTPVRDHRFRNFRG